MDEKIFWTGATARTHAHYIFAAALFATLPVFASPAIGGAIPQVSVQGPVAPRTTHIVRPLAFRAEPPQRRYEVTAPIRSNVGKGRPKISGPADASLPLVVIDAGHGGHDPGAISPHGGQLEKEVTLAIAKAVRDEMLKSGRVRVALTRDSDKFIVLQDRYQIARKLNADLFISIHADAFREPSARGASIYTLSTRGATSTTAQYLADTENEADRVGGVQLAEMDPMLAGVLADLSMTGTLDTSLNVGRLILQQIEGVARLHKKQVEQAGFVVLKSPDVPSLLVETGFISNPQEADRLATPAYQDKMARAIRRGIQTWFARQPPPGTLLAWQREQGGREVTIAVGDTLSQIAERFGVPVADIKSTNGLSRDVIYIGQTLVIPEAP